MKQMKMFKTALALVLPAALLLQIVPLQASASVLTAGISSSIGYAQSGGGYNSWAGSLNPGVGIAPITPGFEQMMSGFFGAMDDGLVYILCDEW